jgi:GNAT superfamily N-acetyltransferase
MSHTSTTIKKLNKGQLGFRKRLERKIDTFNRGKAGPTQWAPLDLEVKDQKGRSIGGLTGYSYLGWLYIDILFINAPFRGRDIGTQLLQKAEAWAKKRKCRYVHLITFSFQARDFYQKLGYELYGEVGPFAKDHVKYYLKKAL